MSSIDSPSDNIMDSVRIPSNKIIKIVQLDQYQNYKRIFVFHGKREPVESLHEIFSDIEIANIELYKSEVIFSKQQIHIDDTIQTIKYKLIQTMELYQISYHEIYLFANSPNVNIHLERMYNEITKSGEYDFTAFMLGKLLLNLNISEEEISAIPSKETYSLEELQKYIPNYNTATISIPIGKKFSSFRNLLFSVNPFDIVANESIIFQPTSQNPLLTYENSLLLNYGEQIDNTIYACFVEDVLDYAIYQNVDQKYIISLYFPILTMENIFDKDSFLEKKQSLIQQNKKYITPTQTRIQKKIDMFYNVFYQGGFAAPLDYISKGIVSFDIILHPEMKTTIPLEALFKNIHADETIPFIKYNPGSRQENVLRLYYNKITKTGKKIPYLSKGQIHSLSRQSGKQRQISLYISTTIGKQVLDVFLDFDANGDIHIRNVSENRKELISIEQFTDILLKNTINGVLDNIQSFLQNTGYKIPRFEGFQSDLVEIVQIDYRWEYELRKDFQIADYSGCLTSVFEIVEGNMTKDVEKGALMKYKRVENYKEMDEIQTMITEIYRRTMNERETMDAIMINFHLTEEEAFHHITDYLNQYTRIQGQFVNKAVTIAENPGFITTIRNVPFENKIIIDMKKINAIAYLEPIHSFIDSFLRITQESKTIPEFQKIMNICKPYKRTESSKIPELDSVIIPVFDSILPNQFETKIDRDIFQITESEEAVYGEEDEDDDDFIIYDEEEEYAQEEEEEENQIEEDNENEAKQLEMETSEKEPPTATRLITGGEKNPSKYFFNKLKRLDPELFLVRKEGQYDAFSRVCQPTSRQPVVITEEEKNRIDSENRGAYGMAIRYGSNPDNKNWYICPRFWCMKTNTPLTEQQVNDGVCADNYHEFTSKKHVDENGKYVTHNPSLVKDAHPTSGVPCCFKKAWNSDQLVKQRQEYGITKEDISYPIGEEPTSTEDKRQPKVNIDNSFYYVIEFNKYPISQNRWGFLPPAVQSFLQIHYADVISKKNAALIQSGANTFLRYGVEQSKTQSFIGCIANIYASVNRLIESNKPVPTIKEMRHIIVDAISLDHYVQYQNGSFANIFRRRLTTAVDPDIIQKYANTEFYKNINLQEEAQHDFLEDTIDSLEHFKEFLLDDNAVIDHTYLWDIIVTPNNKLFPAGLNLVLLEIQKTDITEQVDLLCPTNSYMNKFYDPLKETVILLKHDEFYEPIYSYHLTTDGANTEINWNATFIESKAPPSIKRVLQLIQNTSGKYCRPLPSMPKKYNYKRNLSAVEIVYLLKTYKRPYVIESQIRNYSGKTIALFVKPNTTTTKTIYLPCFPSPNLPNIPLVFMDTVEWTDFETTYTTLSNLKRDIPQLLCDPLLKVVENGLIVGILTETNQFVQIDPPISADRIDNLETFHAIGYGNKGFFEADKAITTVRKKDEMRLSSIRNIGLEAQFYASFRTTARILLGEHDKREIRKKLIEDLDNHSLMFSVKLKNTMYTLQILLKGAIQFITFEDTVLNDLEDISTCISSYDSKKYCLIENTEYQPVLLLPKQNLLNPEIKNNDYYFRRLADELIRYKRIRLFLLEPKQFLNITNMEYKISPHEFILLQSLLDGNYFDDLIPFQINDYVENIPYDLAQPIIQQKYSNLVSLKEQETENTEISQSADTFIVQCVKETLDEVIGNQKSEWKRIFPSSAKEIILNHSSICTFYLIVYIYNKHTGRTISIETLKGILITKYSQIMPKHKDNILSILSKQGGKREMIKRVQTSRIQLDTLIKSEEYYLTNLDLWALADILKLPILLFSTKPLKNLLLENINWVILGGNRFNDSYFCIRSPVESKDTQGGIPNYQLIDPPMKLSSLREDFITRINNEEYVENNLSFESYLDYHHRHLDR